MRVILIGLILLTCIHRVVFSADAQPIEIPYTTSSWKAVSPAGVWKNISFTKEEETLACSFKANEACGLIIYRQRGWSSGYHIKVVGVSDGKVYHDSRTDMSASPQMVVTRIPAGDYLLELQNAREEGHVVILSMCKFTIEQMDKMEAAARAQQEETKRLMEEFDKKQKEGAAEKNPSSHS